MIARLRTLFDGPGRRRFDLLVVLNVVAALLYGFGALTLHPLITALVETSHDRGRWTGAIPWVGVIIAVVALHHIIMLRTTIIGYDLGARLLTSTQQRIGTHMARIPLGWFDTDRSGQLSRLISAGAMDISSVPGHFLRPVTVGYLTPPVIAIGMCVIDWRIGMLLCGSLVVCSLALGLYRRQVRADDESYEQGIVDTSSKLVEFARTQAVLRSCGVLERHGANGYFGGALRAQESSQRQFTVRGARGLIAFYGAVQLALTVVIAATAYLSVQGHLTSPKTVSLLLLALIVMSPLVQVGELVGHLEVAGEAIRRIAAVVELPALPEPEHPAAPSDNGVELDAVSFGYGAEPVLRDFTMTVPPRSFTAVVGPSGAGKSTLLSLIARFFDVDRGAVRIGGADVRDLGTEVVLEQLSVVFQDVYLFDGTIADNLRMASPGADQDALDEAARISRLDEVIARLPDGWDTRVGESGSLLSGGEKQRVSIARALMKNARVVLFDEATAALDPINERAVSDALTRMSAHSTVIVVAHRLPTILAADQVVVVDGGRVVDTGTAHELRERGGLFETFWAHRERAGNWTLR